MRGGPPGALLLPLLLSLLTAATRAATASPVIDSRECFLRTAGDRWSGACASPTCGPLNATAADAPFAERLSQSCAAYLENFRLERRALDLVARLPRKYYSDDRTLNGTWCWTMDNATQATNPVVVQSAAADNFVMCTIPKAGCSLLRALLLVAQHAPAPVGWVGERANVHGLPWPSLDFFDAPQRPLPLSYPTFVVSRDPYVRFLSGFLDKMTLQDHGHDWLTMAQQNAVLGRPLDWPYPDSKWAFAEFTRAVAASLGAGVRQNEHFMPALDLCRAGEVRYHYGLRLEDMAQWWPCLEEGLQLEPLTASGWAHERKSFSDWYSPAMHRGCFWSPPGLGCAEYRALTRDGDGHARPGADRSAARDGAGATARTQYDIHATGAADKWRSYYDQATGDIVYNLFRADFEAFGYKRQMFD